MKQNKSVQIIFLSLILSCFFLSGEVFAYKKSDLKKFKNTKKCIKCDLTDLNLSGSNLSGSNLSGANLSGANLSGANLSGANLSGANLSGANLSGANLSGANLSGANLSETNLKEVNLTYANLSEIIIDEKAFSTLDVSEHTFMNKSTLAEETKKKKEQALRKKKEQALRKKKEQALRKKKEQSLRKKKEQSLRKKKEQALRKKKEQALRKKKEQSLRKKKEQSLRKKKEQSLRKKKEQSLRKKKEQTLRKKKEKELRKKMEKELRKKMEDGYKDIKFNMDDETAFIILKSKCSFAYKDKFEDYGKISGSQCYKIMGKKRSIELKFRHDCFNYDDPCLDKEPSDILMIEVSFSMIKENSLKTLLNSLNQKYKLYKKVKIGKVFYKVFAEGNVVTKRVTGDMGTFLSLQFINPTFVSKYLEKLGFSEPELSSDDI